MAKHRYEDIDILAFLEEKVLRNTTHYQSDFEVDKRIFASAAASQRPEDKTLLWLSRPLGTQCVKEHDAFLCDTAAHVTWRYFAEQLPDQNYLAYAVEVTGEQDGVLRGNIYELDYLSHAAEVAACSVAPLEEEKTFSDGFAARIPFDHNYNAVRSLVSVHGPVTDTLTIPHDPEALRTVLSAQKSKRRRLALANKEIKRSGKPSLSDQIQSASARTVKAEQGRSSPVR